jgi:predicted secreted Zn-dependent protease
VTAPHKQINTDTTWLEVKKTSDNRHVSLSSVAPTLNVTYSIPGPE